jgi:acetylornithine deacetylase
VRRLIDVLEAAPVRPFACLIGEPTDMVIATGHKGKTFLKGCCHGLEGHSALAPHAVNAIHLACDMIGAIRDMQVAVQETGSRDSAYDVPYSSLHVGTIKGGKALNIVPNLCEFDFEIRNLAADDPLKMVEQLRERGEQIAQRSRSIFPKARIEIEVHNSYPGLDSDETDEGFQFLAQLAESSNRIKVAFGTEGGLFASRLSVPVAVCGPGSITHAHKPDEFVSIEQLSKCDAMMERLVKVLQK